MESFEEARKVLEKFVPPARKFREAYTLDNMRALMAALGNPQESYRVIHVAGTSGKTSTSYYIASLLSAAGQRTGLTVSPHVSEINERTQINMVPLAEEEYCRELSTFLEIINKLSTKPTYFEVLVAFAYWEFAKQNVDYAVIEVGLGGLLDGTNVITRSDKVCVITDIGLDHMNILGSTIPEIATQKAGIVHAANHVFMYSDVGEAFEVVKNVCESAEAELHHIANIHSRLSEHMPLFQERNWWLAKNVYDYICERDGLKQLTSTELLRTQQQHIPARMELVQIKGDKRILLDGAHNFQKMEALVDSLIDEYPKQKMPVLIAFVSGKSLDIKETLSLVLQVANHIIISGFHSQQDLKKTGISPEKIAKMCNDIGFDSVEVAESPEEAYRMLQMRPENISLVCGSFYLLNHVRPLVMENTVD